VAAGVLLPAAGPQGLPLTVVQPAPLPSTLVVTAASEPAEAVAARAAPEQEQATVPVVPPAPRRAPRLARN